MQEITASGSDHCATLTSEFAITVDFYPSFTGTWSSPTIRGTRPPPCSSLTLTMIDDHRAVLFGGRQPPGRSTKDGYILDLTGMVCTYKTNSCLIKYFPHTVTLPQLAPNGVTVAPVPVAWHRETIV